MTAVGIDLGTTYSVIATPRKFEGEYFDSVRGVTVIKDAFKQRITPSVIAMDMKKDILVGRRAKRQQEPIMFAKRSMGEEKTFVLKDRQMTPEEVEAQILRYLKEMAEKQMGEKITEAVITVPAYFTTAQKQKTKRAGELAGLRVEMILQEPVAAALMYCYDDNRDPLTIMTYDLGGGTFDVAILQKKDGVFTIGSFDGDRYLGGVDFDKALAHWIIDMLNKQGYRLEINPGVPRYETVMNELLILAETIKIKLTDHETTVVAQDIQLVDDSGEPIRIDMEISRDIFEKLIEKSVDETLQYCDRAVEKAGIESTVIDDIVMVGGSSRIPLVSKKIENVFGKKPKLIDPDLCVGIGAAIMARMLGTRIDSLKLSYIPESTSAETFQITGSLEKTPLLPNVTGCKISLSPTGEASQTQKVQKHGGFLFPNISLVPNADNHFTLQVIDPEDNLILTHQFSIRQVSETETVASLAGLEPNILAKPISILTEKGLHVVAPEKTPLPYECKIPAQTTDQKGVVRVPIYEDTYPIGEILVDAVAPDLPVGSRVEISLHLRPDFFIDGKAYIPAIDVEGKTRIEIKSMAVNNIDDLKEKLENLEKTTEEALSQADRSKAFKIAPRLRNALNKCRRILYEDRDPNLARAQEFISETEMLIKALAGWEPDPPSELFDNQLHEIKNKLLPDLYNSNPNARKSGFEGRLNSIAVDGRNALATQNEIEWADTNRRLNELHREILSLIDQPEQPPDSRVIKLKLGMDLMNMQEEVRKKKLVNLESEVSTCEKKLKDIDPSKSDAMEKLYHYYENLHKPLHAKINQCASIKSTVPKELDGLLRLKTIK